MNKREAIEKIKDLYSFVMEDGPFEVDLINKNQAIDIISQIDEPQKPVVPKFVAEWIEDHKGYVSKWDEEDRADFVFMAINDLFRFVEGLKPLDFTIDEKVSKWMIKNTYKFITAILFGYEVEQEKLYTVEIADAILTKITRGRNIQYKMLSFKDVSGFFDNAIYNTKLTEQEIIGADERLWQFAKEVEVE